ncbi:MAG: S41 family peptidase [Planctomycetota bacterium]|jgi:carboxyl-terminal processing protease
MDAPWTRHWALFAALLLLPAAPAARAQEEGASLREIKVKEILARCKGAEIPEIWRNSDQLVALGPPAKRAIQGALAGAEVEAQLAVLRALIELDSPTFAAERLMDLAGGEGHRLEHRIAALELIGLSEEVDAEDGLLELLIALNPQIRIAAARALWRIDSPRRGKAKETLVEFVKSSDPELRAQGALALAEMGDAETPNVLDILLELRKEPGLRGKYANALYRWLFLKRTTQMAEARGEAAAARRRSPLWRHLDEAREMLRQFYDLPEEIDDEQLRIGAARGMLDLRGDPHTLFLTPDEYREFLHGGDGVDPSYGGIGAYIDTNVKGRFRILRPIFGGPAWKADIRGGDDIVAVNGEPTAGRSTTDIIKQIKGPPGTPVILSIFREGWAEHRDVKVIRQKIVLPTVYSRMLPGQIGYVAITVFAYETGQELQTHLARLETEGLRGLVIDLRDNPGGLLDSVKECLTLFLKQRELICTAKGRIVRRIPHHAGKPDRQRRYPLAALVNERSASGAELMAGVLQHYSKTSTIGGAQEPYLDALVVGGPTTFGKGTMQHTLPLRRSWPGETFEDTPRKNGYYDRDESFTDRNDNRRWDAGEPFEDRARLNGRWNDAEQWEDANGNGKWDLGEEFKDENGDGVWNPAEAFTDANGNGQYDYGAAVKMTVARYYLPGGTNFTRRRVYDEKAQTYVYKGGVVADIKLERERMEISHLVELRDLQEEDLFRDYVKSRWEDHKEAFRTLAHFDGRDPSRYPDFDAFNRTLKTRLSPQEVRRAIRLEIRREVAGEQGKEILGDLSDDNVLRRGVEETLRRLGTDPTAVPEYRQLQTSLTPK